MKAGRFRFASVLDVYTKREEAVMEEIAALRGEQKGIQRDRAQLLSECGRARSDLGSEEAVEEARLLLQYIEGLMHRVQATRDREALVQTRIAEKMEELKGVRTERMRFDKLKERHEAEVRRVFRTQEQKVTDEFAQRKKAS